jgi:thioredoxin 1
MAHLTITDQNFDQEVLKSDKPVLVDFWAVWCGPCKIVEPIVDELTHEYEGKIKVGKVNVDENEVAGNYGIMSIPTLMIFKNGQPVKSMVGAQSKENFKQGIEEVLAS